MSVNEEDKGPEQPGPAAPPPGGDAQAQDAKAAAIAAAKAKAAEMAAARVAAAGMAESGVKDPAPAEPAPGGDGPAQDAKAAAIAAAKAKAAALAAARARGGAAAGGPAPAPGNAPGAPAPAGAAAAGAAPAARPAPPAKAPPPPPPLDPALAPLKAELQKRLPDVKFDDRTFRIIGIEVDREHLLDVARRLYDMPETRMDYLACLSGVDYPDGIEVVYHLASTTTPAEVALRVKVPKEEAECHVPSVTGLWPGANWHEREAFDLLGVRFDGHPDLRRILLPEGFDGGYPLRKDFKDEREARERKVRVR